MLSAKMSNLRTATVRAARRTTRSNICSRAEMVFEGKVRLRWKTRAKLVKKKQNKVMGWKEQETGKGVSVESEEYPHYSLSSLES